MASFRVISSVHVEFSQAEMILLNRVMRIATTFLDEPVQFDQRFNEDDLNALETLYGELPSDSEL